MTRKEAVIYFKSNIENLKRILDKRPNLKDSDLDKEIQASNIAIKALEQEPVLDKIRAEIDIARFIDKDTKLCKNANASGLEVALQIIDKYKLESGG